MSKSRSAIGLALLLATITGRLTAGEEGDKPVPKTAAAPAVEKPVDQAALEKEFTDLMSGVVFSGSYSVVIDGKERPAQMEKYTILKVVKVKDDLWQFTARIQYGQRDITLPMVLPVKWAGDTPMITLTNLAIPGLGTFTSRVLIYGDRYAGTWQHDKVGGHLWGTLEKVKQDADQPSAKKDADKSDK